ncbi:1-acylglycerol-3-phosphate O-acyltransferase [Salmonella enterica subsp. enterica]|uniref:1-acylglycerol-3-phosphate O-acyltransferase n=1 Tax=Salmonella enterica I TaxID=59201 RepID=A0A3S4JAQ0_SALET|nr:1-acylglycerol-3-phosphate O-acyltransferase [Salmonella enterica subsp. enterica]
MRQWLTILKSAVFLSGCSLKVRVAGDAVCCRLKPARFHAAIAAGVPIIPVCVSNTSNKVNLNRLNNGLVIVEMLPPVDVSEYGKDQVRELAAHCRALMEQKNRGT